MHMKIECEKISNIRDLGGIQTKDHKRIKENLFVRSNMLYGASQHDLALLKEHGITLIVDFRNPKEVQEKPDPVLEGARWENIPIIHDEIQGISHEKETDSKVFSSMNTGSYEESVRRMIRNYRGFLTTPYSIDHYREFIHEVMEEEGAVLWHCSAGKDRAGIATIFVLELLGVNKEDIYHDYMLSHENLKSEIESLTAFYMTLAPELQPEPLLPFFEARKEYFDEVYATIEQEYNGMDAFLKNQLKISEAQRDAFKKKALEDIV